MPIPTQLDLLGSYTYLFLYFLIKLSFLRLPYFNFVIPHVRLAYIAPACCIRISTLIFPKRTTFGANYSQELFLVCQLSSLESISKVFWTTIILFSCCLSSCSPSNWCSLSGVPKDYSLSIQTINEFQLFSPFLCEWCWLLDADL